MIRRATTDISPSTYQRNYVFEIITKYICAMFSFHEIKTNGIYKAHLMYKPGLKG